MRKKTVLLSLIIAFIFASSNILKVNAEENNSDEPNIQEGEEYSAEYGSNGYEDWLPDYNPKLREMYGGYNRNGNFYVVNLSTGSSYQATNFKVYWKPGGGTGQQFYVPSINQTIEKTSAYATREYIGTNGTFVLKRNCSVFSVPIFHSRFITSEVLPAGTYTVTNEALEFVELQKPDGKRVWVVPQYTNSEAYMATNQGYFTNSKAYLNATSVNGKPIKKNIMPIREDKRTGIAMQPKYVTIHNTASEGRGANAAVHANLQINDSRKWISWHYSVDNNEIYQSMPMNEVGYHAGDGQNIGNSATIGIEICENSDGNYAQAEKNAAFLTAQILYENGLPANAVRMHKDWSGKHCAHNILDVTKGSMGWTAFLSLVKQEYDRLVMINSVDQTIPAGFEPFVTATGLEFSQGLTTGFNLSGKVQDLNQSLKTVDPSAEIVITKNGNNCLETDLLATGQLVTVKKGDKQFRFQVVIKGDTSGDGKISSLDYATVKNDILNINKLSGSYQKAADINKDGRVSAIDYVYIKNDILNIGKITQK